MSDSTFTLSPDDLVGAVQRQTGYLASYLQQPISEINPGLALEHLDRMRAFMAKLNEFYLAAQRAGANGRDAEKRVS